MPNRINPNILALPVVSAIFSILIDVYWLNVAKKFVLEKKEEEEESKGAIEGFSTLNTPTNTANYHP